MKCPDRETLARLLDGESGVAGEDLRSHIERCVSCREKMKEDHALGGVLHAFFSRREKGTLSEGIPCPDAEEIAAYVEGRISPYRKIQILKHFCACPACAEAVIGAATSIGEEPGPLPAGLAREARALYGSSPE